MFGLLTNHEKLLAEDDEISDRVRSGAAAMAAARGRRNGVGTGAEEEEESAICLVITNGVEVVDEKGRGLGIAVYDLRGFKRIPLSFLILNCHVTHLTVNF
ncbi:unnamed protein product [Linum trigynum]|uniref:Uncharacterized protein n=1 Tax=Linum trigynum TaxID=586398 RepID=A0AAV2FBP7_9ROSI